MKNKKEAEMADEKPSLIKLLRGEEKLRVNVEHELSDKGFEYWVNRPYIESDLKKGLLKANVLIVPAENFRDVPYQVFPIQTVELFEYIKDNAPQDVTIDLCASDKDYRELALHGDIVQVASMVIQYAVWPIVIGIVSRYIYDRLGIGAENANVKSELFIEKEGKTIALKYDGPASSYENTLRNLIDKI